jgi:hypothetical protein
MSQNQLAIRNEQAPTRLAIAMKDGRLFSLLIATCSLLIRKVNSDSLSLSLSLLYNRRNFSILPIHIFSRDRSVQMKTPYYFLFGKTPDFCVCGNTGFLYKSQTEERVMKNTIKVLGLIALAAVIGFSMAACKNGTTPTPTDPALNGTWVGDYEIFTFSNGTFEMQGDGGKMKGTFTTSDSTLTITPTHAWGPDADPSLEARWYTKAELLELASSMEEYINTAFSTKTVTYSVSGNTLTITVGGRDFTYTKS